MWLERKNKISICMNYEVYRFLIKGIACICINNTIWMPVVRKAGFKLRRWEFQTKKMCYEDDYLTKIKINHEDDWFLNYYYLSITFNNLCVSIFCHLGKFLFCHIITVTTLIWSIISKTIVCVYLLKHSSTKIY